MKKIVFTFGRMNPPTIGHEKLANKIKSVAKREKADARIYLSHTQNPTKDPLSYQQKLAFAKKAFGIAHRSNAKQIFQILKEIYAEEYTDIIMVVGSDRVTEFKTLLNKYNGKGDYEFDSIKVVSAGQRDPDAKGVEGMSGTKLRAIAKDGDFDTFKQAAASKLSDRDKKRMMDMVAKALKEEIEEIEWTDEDSSLYEELQLIESVYEALTPQQRRKRAMIMKRLAPKLARQRKIKAKQKAGGEKLQQRARKQAIQKARERIAGDKGAKYKDLSPSARQAIDKRVQKQSGIVNKLAQKLLPSVKRKEMERVKKARGASESFDALVENALLEAPKTRQDSDIKDREGTQPAKYYAGDMSKATKEKRAAHFAKKKAGPAPGDSTGKTKESEYTKKYKQMFGDTEESLWANIHKKRERIKQGSGEKMRKVGDKGAPTPDQMKRAKGESVTEEQQLDEKIKGLVTKSEKSGISYGILKKVYDRGMAAWKTGHRPGTTPQQWAFARVNSFITGGKTRTTADKDLWSKHRGKSEAVSPAQQAAIAISKKEKAGKPGYDKEGKKLKEAFDLGSDAHADHTKDMTPGQAVEMTVKDKKLPNLRVATGKSARFAKAAAARSAARKEKKKDTTLAAAYNVDDDFGGKPVKKFKDFKKKSPVNEAIQYHLDTGVPFADNIFRHDSPSFYSFFQEARVRWRNGELEPDATDKQILMTDIGMFGIYEDKEVPLDCPLMEEEKKELNVPKRGGSKKFYVYVKNDKGNVIKVSFGDTSGLKAKISDREAARNFASRHQCDTKNDKTKPGYWACRLPWYAKSLGLEGGGKYFW